MALEKNKTHQELLEELQDLREKLALQQSKEEQLRHSNTMLSAVLDALPVVVNVVDKDLNLLEMNQKMMDVLGIEGKNEVLGEKCYKAFRGRDAPCPECAMIHVFKTGKPATIFAWEGDDQEFMNGKCIRLYAGPVLDEAGNMIGAAEAGVDITDLRKAELALKDSEQRYRLLAENVHDVIWTLNEHFHATYVSPSVQTLLGYTPEEVLVLPLGEYFPSSEGKRLLKAIEQLGAREEQKLCEDSPKFWEFEMKKKDGSSLWVEVLVSPLWDAQGAFKGVIGVTRDISKRKQVEQSLQQSEARSRAMLEAMPDMMFTINRDGVILDYKAERADLYKQDDEGVIGGALKELLPAKVADTAMTKLEQVFKTGNVRHFEYQLPIPSRGVRSFEARMAPSGKNEALVVVRDITKLRHVERALYESNQRLRLAMLSAKEGAWEMDFVKSTTSYDENAANMLGLEMEEAVTPLDWWKTKMHPDDLPRVLREFNDCRDGRTNVFHSEYRMQRKDGSYCWIVGSGCVIRRNPEGAPTLLIGINRDITPEKHVEHDHAQAQKKWRSVLENINQICLSLNPEGRLVFANNYFLQLTGWELDDIVGQDWFSLFLPPEQTEQVRKVFHALMTETCTHGCDSYKNEIVLKNGERRMIAWSNVLTKDSAGKIIDVTSLGVDVTTQQ